jgi:hypothetical protein
MFKLATKLGDAYVDAFLHLLCDNAKRCLSLIWNVKVKIKKKMHLSLCLIIQALCYEDLGGVEV